MTAVVRHSADATTLVTGGSGFIGTNLVERLRELGRPVVNFDRAPPLNPVHSDLWREADLLDRAGVAAAVRETRPAAVFHLGARTDLAGESLADYAANTEGTSNLLDALQELPDPPPLVVASTRMVCRIGYQPRTDDDYCPPNAYGESKVETERITRDSGYPGNWAIVRPTSIWGPWFDVPYRDFFLAVARGRYRHPSGARVRKSFGYVENTVAQTLALLDAPEAVRGRVFYLADYEPIEVLDWAERIGEATGARRVRTVPLAALRAVAAAGDAASRLGWKRVPLTRFRLDNLMTEMVHDLEPIRAVLPELPVGLDQGIERTVTWLRARGDLDGGGAR